MMITISVNADNWTKKAKQEFKSAMKTVAAQLSKSINENPEKYEPKK